MFTGIIEALGKIKGIQKLGRSIRMSIDAGFSLDETKLGDSIAVSGVCLTAVEINGRIFKIDMSPETYAVTNFSRAKVGDRVNLERALRLCDRLDGHLVSGHIDGTGRIISIKILDNAIIITIGATEALTRYMIKKGSVAVDGISLTINNCTKNSFEITIIPHTAKLTTIGFKKTGDIVNIETDMIGKYVERFMTKGSGAEKGATDSSIDMQFLAKTGFL
ncbi:MAG: riboflavin synthase [Deltaproteobacteria bacterium]|nr:riboflavin synthase [Deltaproteobacteria bacterium]